MKQISSVLLMFLVSVVPALAADKGFFLSADLGGASYSDAPTLQNCSLVCSVLDLDEFGSSSIAGIGGGYQYSKNLGVEIGYINIGDSESTSSSGGNSDTETLSGSSLHIAAVGTISLSDSFNLFGRLGLAHTTLDYMRTQTFGAAATSSSANGSDTNAMFGVGAQYNFNQSWGIRAQYENLGKVQVGSAGAAYNSEVGVAVYSVGGVYRF